MGRFFRSRMLIAGLLLVAAAPSAMAQQPTASVPGASVPGAIYPPIAFGGQTFDFHDKRGISAGSALYYAPQGQDPDLASQSIIINYYNAKFEDGHAVSAEGIAKGLLQRFGARGGNLVASFAVPAKSAGGKLTYFVVGYYLYPADGNADIWFAKIEDIDGGVVGILYKRQIAGGDADTVANNTKDWLRQNLKMYGSFLGALTPPPAPSSHPSLGR